MKTSARYGKDLNILFYVLTRTEFNIKNILVFIQVSIKHKCFLVILKGLMQRNKSNRGKTLTLRSRFTVRC